jgi:hypothetical protein
MNNDAINMKPGDPEYPDITLQQKEEILSLAKKMMEMGVCAVYGVEDDDLSDATVDCAARLDACKAICCSFHFALTKDEVQKGRIKHDPSRPFFIARDADGYCPHLDRTKYRCDVWAERPLRCRVYDCRTLPQK